MVTLKRSGTKIPYFPQSTPHWLLLYNDQSLFTKDITRTYAVFPPELSSNRGPDYGWAQSTPTRTTVCPNGGLGALPPWNFLYLHALRLILVKIEELLLEYKHSLFSISLLRFAFVDSSSKSSSPPSTISITTSTLMMIGQSLQVVETFLFSINQLIFPYLMWFSV